MNCKYISEMLQSLCKQVGLLTTFDVYSDEFTLIDFLNANKYDLVFIHQTLIYGKHGDHLILNLRCLLSFTPVIIVGLSSLLPILSPSAAATTPPSCRSATSPRFFASLSPAPIFFITFSNMSLKSTRPKSSKLTSKKSPKNADFGSTVSPFRSFRCSYASSKLQIARLSARCGRNSSPNRRFGRCFVSM